MICETSKTKLDTYLDGELPSEEMHIFDAHVRSCASCAAEALERLQIKRCIQTAGRRFVPSAQFRRRIERIIEKKSSRSVMGVGWMVATAMISILAVCGLIIARVERIHTHHGHQVYGELVDLHVATLASLSPVDVVSTDRHTVKPWFEGKIPFTFDLPELQNSDFSLLGGRIAYLEQTPGAQLIYKIRKHEISVFIFQEGQLHDQPEEGSGTMQDLSFNLDTWRQGGLRYCIVGDVSASDIRELARLLKGNLS
jgi:anti-sigma factor RsiW